MQSAAAHNTRISFHATRTRVRWSSSAAAAAVVRPNRDASIFLSLNCFPRRALDCSVMLMCFRQSLHHCTAALRRAYPHLDGTSFQYWVDAGLVSGGAYNSTDGCKPYPFKPCEYPFNDCHVEISPKCTHHCRDGVDRHYSKDKLFGKVAYSVPRDERAIRYEIMTNGPVEAGFDVYEDVLLYKSGVYRHVYGEQIGKHAVRIIGWGRDGGIPYWLIANSYGDDWGDHGYFKFVRGSNHLGIESKIITGLPLI